MGSDWKEIEKERRKVGKRVGSLVKSSQRELGSHTQYITSRTRTRTRMHGALFNCNLLAGVPGPLVAWGGRRRDRGAGIKVFSEDKCE